MGELIRTDIEPDGSVTLTISDDEGYAHEFTVSADEMAEIAEASRIAAGSYSDLPRVRGMT